MQNFLKYLKENSFLFHRNVLKQRSSSGGAKLDAHNSELYYTENIWSSVN